MFADIDLETCIKFALIMIAAICVGLFKRHYFKQMLLEEEERRAQELKEKQGRLIDPFEA